MTESEGELLMILDAVAELEDSAFISRLLIAIGAEGTTRRTLQRRLLALVRDGRLVAVGQGPGRRYMLPNAQVTTVESRPEWEAQTPPFRLGATAMEIRARVNAPLTQRQPVGYQLEFLDAYQPNVTSYLPSTTRTALASVGKVGITSLPAGTYIRQLLDRLLIDLSWNSSRLEGNTYSLLETQRLLDLGEIAEGKAAEDAQMILNHKAAIEMLASQAEEIGFNRYTLCNLHGLLSENLLPDPAACGRIRSRAVGITGTVFHPLENPQLIEEQFLQFISKGAAIEDPFEQAFFAMVHLPYLQPFELHPFEDGNKRVSRLAANIPLIGHNLCPLSFVDVPQAEYISGLLGVYERNRVDLLRDVFVWAYERSAGRYSAIRQSLGEPDRFRLRYRAQIGALVQAVVQEGLEKPAAIGRIRARAASSIAEEDQARFVEIVEVELTSLHEGNIARYRLRPREFAQWHEAW